MEKSEIRFRKRAHTRMTYTADVRVRNAQGINVYRFPRYHLLLPFLGFLHPLLDRLYRYFNNRNVDKNKIGF